MSRVCGNRAGLVGLGSLICWCMFFPAPRLGGQAPAESKDHALPLRPLYHETQHALDNLSRAEITREAASSKSQSLEPARKNLRTVIRQLKLIETKLSALLRATYQQPPSARAKDSWSIQELESLVRNLRVQQARAYRNQALCYDDRTTDRLNALSLALQQLPDIVTLPLDERAVWQARIEQVVCLRLLNKMAEATTQTKRWLDASPPAAMASRLWGEQLRVELKRGAVQQALASVVAHVEDPQQRAGTVAETDDVILEILLVARQHADPEQTSQLTQQATRQLKHIGATHGLFWKRRAEIRMGSALAESGSQQADTNDPELLIHAAASLYSAGKLSSSVATYDQVAKLLAAQGKANRRFQVLKTAAAVVRQAGTPEAALQRFRELALEHRDHPDAAPTHLVAIGLAAAMVREGPAAQRGAPFEFYLELLREHLESWPREPSAETVKNWLARSQLPEVQRQRAATLAGLGKRQQSLALYRQLLTASPHDPELLEACARLLGSGTSSPERSEAIQLWQQIEKRSKPGGARWLRGRRARLELLEQLGEGEKARRLRQLTEILYPRIFE